MKTLVNGISVNAAAGKAAGSSYVFPATQLQFYGAFVNASWFMNTTPWTAPGEQPEVSPDTGSSILMPKYKLQATLCIDPKVSEIKRRGGSVDRINQVDQLNDLILLAIASNPETAQVYKANAQFAKIHPLLNFKGMMVPFAKIGDLRLTSDVGDAYLEAGKKGALRGRKTDKENGSALPACQDFLDGGATEDHYMLGLKVNVFNKARGSAKSKASTRYANAVSEYLKEVSLLKERGLDSEASLNELASKLCLKYAFKRSGNDQNAAVLFKYLSQSGAYNITDLTSLNEAGGQLFNGQRALVAINMITSYVYQGSIGVNISFDALSITGERVLDIASAGVSFDESSMDFEVEAGSGNSNELEI